MAAVQLITSALLEIHYRAGKGPEHLAMIRELADIVHNLPGLLRDGEHGKEPYGYHTFRWMWETASAGQRTWLITQFEALHYDYSYLGKPPSPAPRRPVRRSRSAKSADAATLLELDPRAAFVIRHADPGAEYMLIPRGPDEPRFQPAEPGISEFDCLLRIHGGETILVHLRFETTQFEALPARRQTLRWTAPDRDGYLWRRDHIEDGCPFCTDQPR
jgi:hypothetical protein